MEVSTDILIMVLLHKTSEDIDHEAKLSFALAMKSLTNDGLLTENTSTILSFVAKALSPSNVGTRIGREVVEIGACMLSKITSHDSEELIRIVIESGAIQNLVSFANKSTQDRLSRDILSCISGMAKSSRAYCEEMMRHEEIFELTSYVWRRHTMLAFVHLVVTDERTDSSDLQSIVSSVDITSLVKSSMWSVSSIHGEFTQMIDIVTVILKKLRQDSITAAIVNAGVISKFADFILMCDGGRVFINAITSLDLIITTSSLYRDEFMKTDVIKHLLGLEKAVQGACLSIIYHAIEHCSASSNQIIGMMIESDFLPFLIQKTKINSDAESDLDEIGQTFAIKILSVIAREQNIESTYFAMAGAGTNLIANLIGLLERECNAACDILVLLNQIAEFSPYYRVKVISSGIVTLVASGIGSDCSDLRIAWMRLFHTFASGEDNDARIEAWVNSGIIRKLIELKIDSKQPIETETLRILIKAKTRFIKKESNQLDLLHKKKAWLNAKTCDEEVEQLLHLSIERKSLDQLNSQLLKVQTALEKANQEAEAVAPLQNWPKRLENSDLPDCIDTVDREIQRSTLLIDEARSLDVVKKSEQEGSKLANKQKQKKQSKLLAWMSKGK
eukprot:scaffold41112_cov23-Cyclotella_meneghiniana.AAC.1